MYAVYTRWSEGALAVGRPLIIGLYARKGGALKRADESANAAPGCSYFVAVLPEGSEPKYENLTDRVAAFCLTEPQEKTLSYSYSPPQGEPDDNADLPF